MTKYTPLTKYSQLKNGLRVRCKVYYEPKYGYIIRHDAFALPYLLEIDCIRYMINEDCSIQDSDKKIKDLEIIEEVSDEPEKPTIQPYEWYTPQEILEYVKADPRADEEKRFKIRVESNIHGEGESRKLNCILRNNYLDTALKASKTDNIDYSFWSLWTSGTYKGKVQFLYWCDEFWQEITEEETLQEDFGMLKIIKETKNPNNYKFNQAQVKEMTDKILMEEAGSVEESGVGRDTDFLTKKNGYILLSKFACKVIDFTNARVLDSYNPITDKPSAVLIIRTFNCEPATLYFVTMQEAQDELQKLNKQLQAITFAQPELGIK